MSVTDQDNMIDEEREVSTVSNTELNVSTLSNAELRRKLAAAGIPCGPITSSTRELYEDELVRSHGGTIQSRDMSVQSDSQSELRITPDVEDSLNETSECDVFYGLFVPSGCDKPSDIGATYTRRDEVVVAARKIKGARFKSFSSRSEAENYANSQNDTPTDYDRALIGERKENDFTAPKTQELTKLRESIENGELDSFDEAVRANPRFLVSSGDAPVALKISCKWNALHVAAKSNQAAIAQSLIEKLKCNDFWKRLYPSDTEETRQQRKKFTIDLYLNSPDSGSCETPLHFAAKFGHIEMVEFLLMQPGLNVGALNKYGETAVSIAGQRCAKKKDAIEKEVRAMIEEQVYIPIFRSPGNATPPLIGQPWSPDPTHSPVLIASRRTHLLSGPPLVSTNPRVQNPKSDLCATNIVDSPLNVRAFAGPMSPSKASQFHHEWRSPSSLSSPTQRKQLARIRRGDSERGLERVGRELAHREGLKWSEYWDFLGCYTDLSTSAGLDVLEKYLSERTRKRRNYQEQGGLDQVAVELSHLELKQQSLFLLGSEPTKLDQDVLLAVGNITLDINNHQFVQEWRERVLSCPEDQRQRWKTPNIKKCKSRVSAASDCESPGSVGPSPLARSPTLRGGYLEPKKLQY